MDRDISNWGWGQLLELPDHLFGRRYCVGCSVAAVLPGTYFDISEMALPEKAVIWCVHAQFASTALGFATVSLALGDQLPANDAEFNQLEQLLPDIGYHVLTRRDFHFGSESPFILCDMKLCVDTHGRRLVMRAMKTLPGSHFIESSIAISSIPRSLPEWFG